MSIINGIIYLAVLAVVIAAIFFAKEALVPQGIGEVGVQVDLVPVLTLAFGIFLGAFCSQIYDRYLKDREVKATRTDFLIGVLASTILTVFLMTQISEINSAALVFSFAFQNGFLFTTVIEKYGSKKQ